VEIVKARFSAITHIDSGSKEGRKEALRKQFKRKLDDAQQRHLIGIHADSADTAGHTRVWLVRVSDTRPDTNFTSLGGANVRPEKGEKDQ
jgi:hypothetical protein